MPLTTEQASALVDQAIAAGIPVGQIDRFLAQNPGDEARIISALSSDQAADPGAAREADRIAYGYNAAGVPGPSAPQQAYANQSSLDLATTRAVQMSPVMGREIIDPQLVSTLPTATPTDTFGMNDVLSGDTIGAEGWRDILGPIAGLIPGVGPIIQGIIQGGGGSSLLPGSGAPQLPIPGGGGVPILRPPSTVPVLRPPTTINIPGGGGGSIMANVGGVLRRISASKYAKIAAVAAALGITVEQYLAMHPGAVRSRRTMNPFNPKALRRAGRRVDRFACEAKALMQWEHKVRQKKAGGRCPHGKKRSSCRTCSGR